MDSIDATVDPTPDSTLDSATDVETGWDKLVSTQHAKLAHEAANGSAYDLPQVYLHPNTPSRIVTLDHHDVLGWTGFTLGAAFVAAILIPVWPQIAASNPDGPSFYGSLPVLVGPVGIAIWVWFCTSLANKVYGPYRIYCSRHAMIVRYSYQRAVQSLRKSAELGVENAAAAADATDQLAVVLADLTNQEARLKGELQRTESFHFEYRERVESAIAEVRAVTVGLIAPVIAASELAHSKRGNLVLDMSDLCDEPVELDLSQFGLTVEQRKIVDEATAVLSSLSRD